MTSQKTEVSIKEPKTSPLLPYLTKSKSFEISFKISSSLFKKTNPFTFLI